MDDFEYCFLGEIRAFAFNRIPKNWAPCNGQLLPAKGNEALAALLGNTYGGEPGKTFNLPDLRGRVMMGYGSYHSGPTLPVHYLIGFTGGTETVTLNVDTVPPHTHACRVVNKKGNKVLNASEPGTKYLAAIPEVPQITNEDINVFVPKAGLSATTQLKITTIGTAGQSQPHENRMPYQAMSLCIALKGIWPSRP